MKISGIPASPGVAVGPVFLYDPARQEIPRYQVEAAAASGEWQRLEDALHAARTQIADLRDTTSRRVGADEAAIFDAHLLVLEDEELLGAIRERIYERHQNVEAAAWDAMQGYRDQLLAIDDEYLRARADDLKDIAARLLAALRHGDAPGLRALARPSIIVARELLPSDTAGLDPEQTLAFVTEEGGPTSHTAMLARQLTIPAVVGAAGLLEAVRAASTGDAPGGPQLALDGAAGVVEVAPDSATVARFEAQRRAFGEHRSQLRQLATLPAITPDGHTLELLANIGLPQAAEPAAREGAVGVGLFRTEFLFLERETAPSEEEQVRAYVEAARPFAHGTVIVRTLDVGGDKSIPYLPQAPEANPFLGARGLRLCLMPHFRPVFKTQLRALLRAAVAGAHLRVMFPMVNDAGELRQARALMREAAEELEGEGVAALAALEHLPLGAMVETPAAAFTTDLLAAEADFFSIGTNDLTQYVLAVDRMNTAVAPLYDTFAPSVLRAIHAAVSGAHGRGRPIGICGEFAGDPRATPLLLGIGMDELSMTAQALPEVKRVVRACSLARAHDVVRLVYQLTTPREVAQVLDETIRELLSVAAPPVV